MPTSTAAAACSDKENHSSDGLALSVINFSSVSNKGDSFGGARTSLHNLAGVIPTSRGSTRDNTKRRKLTVATCKIDLAVKATLN